MEFSEFSKHAQNIESVSKNTEKKKHLVKLLKGASEETLRHVPIYIQGKLFPSWDDSTTDVGPKTLYTAISRASSVSVEEVEELVAEYGGVGSACEYIDFDGSGDGQQKLGSDGISDDALSVVDVSEAIHELSNTSGSGSKERKVKTLEGVLLDCDSSTEAKYFCRLVLEELRIGVGGSFVRDAIAEAFMIDSELVEYGLMVTNDPGLVASTAAESGESGLETLQMEVGRPVSAMLARKSTAEESLSKAGRDDGTVVVEEKYDGARLFIHKQGDDVSLFTRELVDITDSLPDVVDIVHRVVDSDSVILDSEVVAYESEDSDEPLPFKQVMSRLRRKHNIEEASDAVSLDIHCFDILYNDGRELIDMPLSERRKILESVTTAVAKQWTVDTSEEILQIEQQALENGNEGVMVKNPDSPYQPDNRGWNWIKIKPEGETLDCVVVGGEWGEGRRSDWVGSYMLAVKDDGEFKEVGKVATGITEDQLEKLTEVFTPLIKSERGKQIEFKPEVVFEVQFEEIQESPKYGSGYGLRFPRLISVREDKSKDDIDTLDRMESLRSN
jgi:DNA ligase-1